MKRIFHIFLLLAAVMLPACQNNGDIGDLFGQWAVEDVSVEGARVEDYPYGLVTFRFQSSIIAITQTTDHHSGVQTWNGTWTRTDTTLTFDFDHYGATPPARPLGKLPAWMLLPPQTSTTCILLTENSKNLVFTFLDTAGREVRYTLKKII